MRALGLTVAHRIPLIVGCGLIGLLVAVIVSTTSSTTFRATSTLFASTAAQDVSSAYQGNLAATARVKTYQVLATGPELMVRAAAKSGVGVTGGELASRLETEVPPGTVLLNITANADNAHEAARLSQSVADELVSEIAVAEKPLGGGKPSLGLIVLQPARAGVEEVPAFSVTATVMYTVMGLAVGLVLAVVIPGRVSLWPRRRRPGNKGPDGVDATGDIAEGETHDGGDGTDVTDGNSVVNGPPRSNSHRAREWS
ncbi:YveK family protein [Gordonia sputi]